MKQDKRLRTLILSITFSSFGPIVTFIAILMNTSSTQVADFVRRTVELSVLIFALMVYLKIKKQLLKDTTIVKLQKKVYRLLAIVLMLSALVLIYLFIQALINPRVPEGNVWLGLSIASLGVLFNGYFWFAYRRFDQQKESFVMDSQSKMYQAKTLVDINVVIALSSIVLFENSMISYWIDTIGTLIIAIYLLLRSLTLIKK